MKKLILIAVLGLFACGQCYAKNYQDQKLDTVPAKQVKQNGQVGLLDAFKNPAKYIGKKVCWVAGVMQSSTSTDAQGHTVNTSTWMVLDEKGYVVSEQTFIVNENQIKKTDAAIKLDKTSGDRGDKLVCGTITGSKVVNITVNGKVRAIRVPVLNKVTLDAPPQK